MSSMNLNGTNVTLCLHGSNIMGSSSVALQTIVYCILLVVSIIGNILVIIVVSRTSEIKATVNYFILNMAVSDLLFSVVVIPRSIKELFSDPVKTWYFEGILGSITCKLCYFTQDVCTAVSVLTLVAIAVDRYYAVVYPMLSGVITSKVRKLLVAFIWITAIGFHSPYFLAFRLNTDPKTNAKICIYHWKTTALLTGRAYFLLSSGFLFVLPLLIMSVIYTIILISIKRRKVPGNANSSSLRRYKLKRNRKVLTMVLTVLFAFLICWLPINIYGYLLFFHWYIPPPCPETLHNVIFLCIAYSNAAVNPFIYFALSENYRHAAVNLIKCRSKRRLMLKETSTVVARNTSFQKQTAQEENIQLNEISKAKDLDTSGEQHLLVEQSLDSN